MVISDHSSGSSSHAALGGRLKGLADTSKSPQPQRKRASEMNRAIEKQQEYPGTSLKRVGRLFGKRWRSGQPGLGFSTSSVSECNNKTSGHVIAIARHQIKTEPLYIFHGRSRRRPFSISIVGGVVVVRCCDAIRVASQLIAFC